MPWRAPNCASRPCLGHLRRHVVARRAFTVGWDSVLVRDVGRFLVYQGRNASRRTPCWWGGRSRTPRCRGQCRTPRCRGRSRTLRCRGRSRTLRCRGRSRTPRCRSRTPSCRSRTPRCRSRTPRCRGRSRTPRCRGRSYAGRRGSRARTNRNAGRATARRYDIRGHDGRKHRVGPRLKRLLKTSGLILPSSETSRWKRLVAVSSQDNVFYDRFCHRQYMTLRRTWPGLQPPHTWPSVPGSLLPGWWQLSWDVPRPAEDSLSLTLPSLSVNDGVLLMNATLFSSQSDTRPVLTASIVFVVSFVVNRGQTRSLPTLTQVLCLSPRCRPLQQSRQWVLETCRSLSPRWARWSCRTR